MGIFFADGNAINVKINSLFFEKFSFVNQRNKICWVKLANLLGLKYRLPFYASCTKVQFLCKNVYVQLAVNKHKIFWDILYRKVNN